MTLPAPRLLRVWWPGLVLALLIAAYAGYFGALTVQKHNAFQSTAYDLGNVDQAVWNTRHGRILAMTNIEGLDNRLGTHVEPILLPISLLYFVWSDPRALLLLQTLVIGLGAWPVYLLARTELGGQGSGKAGNREIGKSGIGTPDSPSISILALSFAVSYLLYPALESANYFDFHAVALAPTFLLFALYFLETERWPAYGLFALLTMSCKEDAPLLVLMLGAYALLRPRRRWVGLATIIVSLAWFGLAVGVIMPHFDTGGHSPLANRYAYLGDGPAEMAGTLLTRPGLVLQHLLTADNLAYVGDLLLPAGFLSLLAPQVLLLALPSLAVNLLSTDGFMHQLEGFHYGAPLVPAVVVAAAYGSAWLGRRLHHPRPLLPILAVVVLAASLLYHSGHGYTPLAAGFQALWPPVTAHHHLGAAMAREIPTAAGLAALPHANPHASQRRRLAVIDRVEAGLPAPLAGADMVWLDVTDSWPLHPNDLQRGVVGLLAGEYGVERAGDGWLLLRRGAPAKELPDSFYDLARSAQPAPQFPVRLSFFLPGDDPAAGAEPALALLGFDLAANPRDGTHTLALYWQAARPLPAGLRLYPFFFDDASGRVIEDTGQRPLIATVWYPPDRWQPGEIIVTRTMPWDVGTDFAVGVGVTLGDEWSQVGERLTLRLESSPAIVRLFEGNTWARLMGVKEGRPVGEPRVFVPPTPQHSSPVDFGGQVRLLGYDAAVDPPGASYPLADGQHTLRLTLHWQALVRPAASYTVFAQILGPAGTVRAQVDAVPRQGSYPTTWWLPGEVVSDELAVSLPQGFDPAGFRLIVGMYEPTTGRRLAVDGGGDYAVLDVPAP